MSVVWIWCLIFEAEYHDTGICLSRSVPFPPLNTQRSNCLIKHASHSCLAGLFSKECATAMASLNSSLNGGRATDSPSKQPASFACVVCHNRKVKCDRQDPCTPCSNCAKANVECVYRAPPPPRRKRDRETNGSVSQERGKLLRRSTGFNGKPSATQHHHPAEWEQRTEAGKSGSGRMIMKDGNSIYLDK